MNDLRFGLRQLLKSPGFTIVAVLTLALGIGANTAMFSVVNGLLLRPLPYPDPDRLVEVFVAPTGGGQGPADGGIFMDWEDHATHFESIAAFATRIKNLSGIGDPATVNGLEVSADYLRVLGVAPILGRDFTEEDDGPGGDRYVVILTHELWRTYFQSDPDVLGTSFRIDDEPHTVIGVLPAGALLIPDISLLTPSTIRADEWKQIRNYNYVCNVIGRLRADVAIELASAELNAAKQALRSEYPVRTADWGVTVQDLHESTYGNSRTPVLTLLAAVGAVLLIACANVANLLLAKAASRQPEIALRAALGATSGRIIRQLLTESLLLAMIGGAVGILIGWHVIDPLVAFIAPGTGSAEFGIDGNVLLFAVGATLCTGLIFGLFPALRIIRSDFMKDLKQGSRGSSSGSRRHLQSLLIVSETGLTVVLLIAAGLLFRSFYNALSAEIGFNREHALVFRINYPAAKAPTVEHRRRFYREVLRSIEALPGVESVGMFSSVPMRGRGFGDSIRLASDADSSRDPVTGFDGIAGDAFQAMGIPLLRGRAIEETDDREDAAKVMVVNQSLATQMFGSGNPIGQQLHFKEEVWEVVGLVGDVRRFQLDREPGPMVYYPSVFFPWHTEYVVRTRAAPMAMADEVVKAVQRVDPDQPVANLGALEEAVESTMESRTVMLTLLGGFAAVALLLACVGIYGVMAYSVSQRTREIGIRIALGASTRNVITLILRQGLSLVAMGLGIGWLASLAATRLIENQLYSVSHKDPSVAVGVAVLLLVVAALACYLPVRRATKVHPAIALRAE